MLSVHPQGHRFYHQMPRLIFASCHLNHWNLCHNWWRLIAMDRSILMLLIPGGRQMPMSMTCLLETYSLASGTIVAHMEHLRNDQLFIPLWKGKRRQRWRQHGRCQWPGIRRCHGRMDAATWDKANQRDVGTIVFLSEISTATSWSNTKIQRLNNFDGGREFSSPTLSDDILWAFFGAGWALPRV